MDRAIKPAGQGNQTSRTGKGQPGCGGALVGGEVASRGQVGSNPSALLGPLELSWPEWAGFPRTAGVAAAWSQSCAPLGHFPESCSEVPGISERPEQAPAHWTHLKASLTLLRPWVACLPATGSPQARFQFPLLPPWGLLSLHPLHPPLSRPAPPPAPPRTAPYTEETKHKATTGLFIHMAKYRPPCQ